MPAELSILEPFFSPDVSPSSRDVGYAALVDILRLQPILQHAHDFVQLCQRDRRSQLPNLFFFNSILQAELAASTPAVASFPHEVIRDASVRNPIAFQSWSSLPEQLNRIGCQLENSPHARKSARSVKGLSAALQSLEKAIPECRRILDLLAIADDEVILVIHPQARWGARLLVNGIAEMNHLHVFIAEAFCQSQHDGSLRAHSHEVMNSYRTAGLIEPTPIAHAVFQLQLPAALQCDGTIPNGVLSAASWIPGTASPTSLLVQNGERVLLLGELAHPASWEALPKFPEVAADIECLELWRAHQVDRWLANRCPLWKQKLFRNAA